MSQACHTPEYTFGEEIANGITHGIGILLALAGLIVMLYFAARYGNIWHVVSCTIFGITLIFAYTTSTLYHSIPLPGPKRILRTFDHAAIYLLIAGTYTPFVLVSLRGPWGWSLFGMVWGLALIGILQEMWLPRKTRTMSLVIYVLMGWIAVIAVAPLAAALSWAGFAWVAAGGLAYTVGIIFYVNDQKFRHWHGIWHLFVLAGSTLHYFAILLYMALGHQPD